MRKRPKKKTRAVNGPTADELQLQEDKRRLQRHVRNQKTVAALARSLKKAIASSDLALAALANDIADKQGFQIVPFDQAKAVNE
jgi:hypothetical protein